MGNSFFEYAGVPRPRFELWRDILRDVGVARDVGPSRGKPGYEERQTLSRQAIEQLWPHLDVLARLVPDDLSHIHRSIADARAPQRKRKIGDVALDLSHAMSSIEGLILGKPRSEPIQNDGAWEAWLERHLPGREIRWRFARRFVLPEEMPDLPPGPPLADLLRADLRAFAARGDVYMGWFAWYGHD